MPNEPEKDLITCHVLDTTTGRPARSMAVRLRGPEPSSSSSPTSAASAPRHVFHAATDADGRIKLWQPAASASASAPPLATVLRDTPAPSRWRLTFDVEGYFAATAADAPVFFPEAVVVFNVEPGQRYHVPLLLTPYTLTTYRGS